MSAVTEKRSITLDDLYRMVSVEDPRISPDGRWIAFVRVVIDRLENGYKRTIWLCDTESGDLLQLTRGEQDTTPVWSPDGQMLAFASARGGKSQIYLLRLTAPGGEARALTAMPNGATAPAWSPDGAQIAFLSPLNADERAREDADESDPPPADKFEREQRTARKEHNDKQRFDPYPVDKIPYREGTRFVGDRFDQIYVIVTAEPNAGDSVKPRRLTSINAGHSAPEWSTDGRYVYSARQIDPTADEPFRSMGIFRVRVSDGEATLLTTPDYTCTNPLPSPDGRWIAMTRNPVENLTERMTYLSVLPTDGGEVRDLGENLDRGPEKLAWAREGGALYYTAGWRGEAHVCRADPETGTAEVVHSGAYKASAISAGPGGSLAFAASTPTGLIELYWSAPGETGLIQRTFFNQPLLDSLIIQPTHELNFTSADGQSIHGWYILPVGYEEGEQYPLALNIHGGPHAMWGPSEASMFLEWQFHAARGYVVFYCNPRGSDGYGRDFYRALHASWGEAAFDDVMAGVDALLATGMVDPARLAITGGSYGGYMTAWIVGHTDRFVAAVSQRGVYNLLSFYGTSDVPSLISDEYGVLPWEDPELLWQHSPVAYAHQIKTPLLILHSENDFRVPIEQGEQLFAYVRRSGGTAMMYRYPREGHELSRSGEPLHRISRLQHMVDWFDAYCQ